MTARSTRQPKVVDSKDKLQRKKRSEPFRGDQRTKLESSLIACAGWPGEYLVVQADDINEGADECDKVGVGFAAFVGQPDRCERVRGTCLKNQPLAYWRHDAVRTRMTSAINAVTPKVACLPPLASTARFHFTRPTLFNDECFSCLYQVKLLAYYVTRRAAIYSQSGEWGFPLKIPRNGN